MGPGSSPTLAHEYEDPHGNITPTKCMMLLKRLTHAKCMGVNRKALQPYAAYKKPYFYYKLISTTSRVRIRIRYYKLCALHLNVQ